MKLEDDSDRQSTEPREPAHVVSSYEETRVRRGSMKPRQRNLLIVVSAVALLVVLLVVVVVWRRRSATAADETPTPVVSVKVAKADKDAIAAQIVAVGTISPREKSDVGAKISAHI
jgi:multidrug efflux pump subunit AcrA (membrane-fusion protein)